MWESVEERERGRERECRRVRAWERVGERECGRVYVGE